MYIQIHICIYTNRYVIWICMNTYICMYEYIARRMRRVALCCGSFLWLLLPWHFVFSQNFAYSANSACIKKENFSFLCQTCVMQVSGETGCSPWPQKSCYGRGVPRWILHWALRVEQSVLVLQLASCGSSTTMARLRNTRILITGEGFASNCSVWVLNPFWKTLKPIET